MSYPGSNYSSSFKRHIPVSTDYVGNYGNTTSTGNILSTRLTSTGASGYSGHGRRTGESGTTSNLTTKPREWDISGSQENSKPPITDPSRNFSSSFYSSANHGHDKLDTLSSKYSPSPLPSNLRQEEGDKPDPVDPRSSLRKLLDCVKELQDLDVEKCLRDYKIIKEASDPMGLTKEEEYVKSNKSSTRMESFDDEKDHLRRKVSELQAKVSALENQDVTKQEVERIKNEYREKKDAVVIKWKEVLDRKVAEALEKETNFQEQIEKLNRQLKTKDDYIEEIRKALSQVRLEKDQVEKEKTDTLTRLSKEMSSKLNDKNPNITDLSDSNRPTKIAEKYNELYDNEWTDALEELTIEKIYTEEGAIEELLACVQAAYSFCQNAASNQIETLRRTLTNPSLSLGSHGSSAAQSVNPETEKLLQEVRKSQTMSGDILLKEFEQDTSFKRVFKEAVPQYTIKCLELCWLMNMHNPPVALGLPPAKDSTIDGNAFKEYTRTGKTVDFVVWLPLLLHKNGPLLQKGVLQPNPFMSRSVHQKPHSAPANLSKSRHNKKEPSDTSDPQADHLNVGGRTTQEPSIHGTNEERGSRDYLYGKQRQSHVPGYQRNKTTSLPNDPLPDEIRQNVGGQTGYTIGTNQDRMYDDWYGDKNKSTPTHQLSTDYSKSRHDKSHKSTATRNYDTSRASGRSTFENFNSPYTFESNGNWFVLFQGVAYPYNQWKALEKQVWPGSSDA